jgi:hypothetical protein
MGSKGSKGSFIACGKTSKKEKENNLVSKSKTGSINIIRAPTITSEQKETIYDSKILYPPKAKSSNNSNLKECSSSDCKSTSTNEYSIKLIKTRETTETIYEVSRFDDLGGKKYSSSLSDRNFSRDKTSNGASSHSRFKPKFNNSSTDLQLGLNSFEYIKVIGRGTFGKVILVKNKIDDTLFAMKGIRKLHILKTKNLDNLKNERRILNKLKKLSNPFIINLHQTFQDPHKVYMLFDYCNGGELFFHLQKYGRFSEDMVRFYAAEIYCAIQHLHKNNIIFRDLKPENIVLDSNGHIKLIDFGLAKDEIKSDSKINTFCGTNEYIPPEVIRGESYNFNFDWWGFGVLIYELLYGSPPFTDRSGNKNYIFKKICSEEPQYTFNNCRIRISNEAEDLIKSLLKKDRKERIKPEFIPLHPFFNAIDFNDIQKLRVPPPIQPKIIGKDDLSNFDPCFLRENLMSPEKTLKYDIDQNKFSEF